MKELIKEFLVAKQISFMNVDLLAVVIHALSLILLCGLIYWIAKRIVLDRVHRIALKTKTNWDDKLMDARFFRRVVLLLPLFIIRFSVDAVMADYDTSITLITKGFEILIALASMRIIIAFVNALRAIMIESESYKDKPIQSYSQVLKIIVYIFFGIAIFSVITGRTPMFFLTAMGAMSAIVLLIFRDTLLGFIGSIQLASNDMVRIDDWITMEKYGADGTVEEINLTTIKVRNWDKTITTIPTYAMISDSFKNWRGMAESEGRRIKRAVNIKISSIRFCDQAMLDKFGQMRLLSQYIDEKIARLNEFNSTLKANEVKEVNGRHLTNIGVFRKYLEMYIKEHPMVQHSLTCMVRQLPPQSEGLPIEIYAFSKDKEWENYEGIIADIFDHVLAVTPQFDLEVFQKPTGSDFERFR